MSVFQIGPQAIKPTKVGEVSRGLQAFRAGQQQIQQQKQQQQLNQLKLQQLRAQIEQAGQRGRVEIPEGFEPGPISVSGEGKVSRSFRPQAKPKRFDPLMLNDALFKITHDKDGKEIEPSKSDLIALQLAATQSGFEIRKIPNTFPKVGRFGKAIPGTFIYRLIPKIKPKTGPPKTAPKTSTPKIDIRQLTDEQINAIIGSK